MEYQRTIEMDFTGDLQDFYARYLFQQQLQQKLDDTIGDVLEECEDDIYKSIEKALRWAAASQAFNFVSFEAVKVLTKVECCGII